LSLEAYCSYSSSAGYLVPRSALLIFFECGLFCPSKCTVHIILSAGFGPSNHFFSASSAAILFECGFRSLESFLFGQQRRHIIRVRALVPRIVFFWPAASPYYSSADFGPSNHFFSASSAAILFECGLRSLELFSSGQPRRHIIRVRASVPRIALSGQQCLCVIQVRAFLSLESLLRASSASALFECGRSCPSNRSFVLAAPLCYSSAGVVVPRIALSC
jgi:hypothetical protein